MAGWAVIEPYLNVEVMDMPFYYNTSLGSEVGLKLTYRSDPGPYLQVDSSTPEIFSFGTNWSSNWRMYATTLSTTAPEGYTVVAGDGSAVGYGLTKVNEITGNRLYKDGSGVLFFRYPSGAEDKLGYPVVWNSTNFFFITERRDAQGHITTFTYETVNGGVRLKEVTDCDGKKTTLNYVTTHPFYLNMVTSVSISGGISSSLEYYTNGKLKKITDVVGIYSQFTYDSNHRVTEILYPFGASSTTTTQFKYYTGNITNGADVSTWTAVRVVERGVRKFLYLQGYDVANVFPNAADEYTSLLDALPSPDESFDTMEYDLRNTFYWPPKPYDNLPSGIKTALDGTTFTPTSLNTNQFQLGWTKHWLYAGGGTPGKLLSQTVSMERAPSPKDDGGQEGLTVWYDYQGKWSGDSNRGNVGELNQPRYTALREPDGDWSVIYELRNELNNVTDKKVRVQNQSGNFVFDTYVYTYDTNNVDLLSVSRNGVVEGTWGYDPAGPAHRPVAFTNAVGDVELYGYYQDAGGEWRRGTNVSATGLITVYSYNVGGFLQSIVDKTSGGTPIRTNSFTWSNGYRASSIDPRGTAESYIYDGLGRLRKTTYADGSSVSNHYVNLDLVQVTNRLGQITSYGRDAFGQVTSVTNANLGVTSYSYCSCGTLDSTTDPLNNTTSYFYDNRGLLIKTLYPDGSSSTNTYDLRGRVVVSSDASGAITNFYNVQGALYKRMGAGGILEEKAFDIDGNLVLSNDRNGVQTSQTYDKMHRVITRTYPDTGVEKFTYSARGMIGYTNQLGVNYVTKYTYDELGRKTGETNAENQVVSYVYSPASDLVQLTDGKSQNTKWIYDEYGRLTNKTDHATTIILTYNYDANNRLTNRWSLGKGNTRYKYDGMGNLTNVDYAASTDLKFLYDANNRLTNMTDAAGMSAFTYTGFGALASEDGPWASDTVQYSYNSSRLPSSMAVTMPTSSPWKTEYMYDALKRLTNVYSPAGNYGYEYVKTVSSTNRGTMQVKKLNVPYGAYITNDFDGVGRMKGTDARSSANLLVDSSTYVYNLAGQRTKLTRTAGNYVDFTYDKIGQVVTANGKETGGTVRKHEKYGYNYDAAGNLNYRTNNALLETFSVNSLNQLTGESRSGTMTVAATATSVPNTATINSAAADIYADGSFAKDGFTVTNGNNAIIASASETGGRSSTQSTTYNLPASVSFTYDNNGNLTSDGKRSFAYDDENQLAEVSEATKWRTTFTYDGKMRLRIRKEYTWQSSTWTLTNEYRYVYSGNLVVQERSSANTALVSYTRGNDLSGSREGAGGIGGLLARTDNQDASSVSYHADGNGNITTLFRGGLAWARYAYDAFGNTLAATGPLASANVYRFSSKEFHVNSGLIYYLYRFYDSNLQRWPNKDPYGEMGFERLRRMKSNLLGDGPNPYWFVHNNGIGGIDAFGLLNKTMTALEAEELARKIAQCSRVGGVASVSAAGGAEVGAVAGAAAVGVALMLILMQPPSPVIYPDPYVNGRNAAPMSVTCNIPAPKCKPKNSRREQCTLDRTDYESKGCFYNCPSGYIWLPMNEWGMCPDVREYDPGEIWREE